MPGWTFWIDRGGTFTDIIAHDPGGGEHSAKLLSASPAYEDAAVEGMRRLMGVRPGDAFPASDVAAIKMGTTVATNALLERKGVKTLFVTTRGFADSLLIGDQARPDLFALEVKRPAPLYAGVLEIEERLAADGSVVTPLDTGSAQVGLLGAFLEGYASIAIAFLRPMSAGPRKSPTGSALNMSA